MKRIAIGLTVLILMTGCIGPILPSDNQSVKESTPAPTPDGATKLGNEPGGGVYRFVDEEMGVVCYLVEERVSGSSAMDCVPLSEVNNSTRP